MARGTRWPSLRPSASRAAMDLSAHSLRALDWPAILEQLARCARTTLGAGAARALPLAASRDEAAARFAAVDEALALHARGEEAPVGDIGDVTAPVERARRGVVLEHTDLQAVGRTLAGLAALRHWTEARAETAPALADLAQPIDVDAELLAILGGAFDETGQLADAAWPALAEIREGIRQTRRRVQALLEDLLRSDALGDALQDRYITERGGRLVLPVKAARRSTVGIVHDSSRSGETAFVEPAAAVEPQNRLAALLLDERREEHRILGLLTAQVAGHAPAILAALAAATAVDLACARAALGRKLRGVVPRVGSEAVIALPRARHPVLALRGAEVVPNDLHLSAERPGLVLTGPNAGGKTVALKTLGLAALFVRAGIPFPADEGTRIDFFDPVLADVGDLQSVEGDLSTFSGHLLLLGAMLARAAPGALLLLDEVAVGTDPAQGAALARAALEVMVAGGARVVVTTHFVELKALAGADPRFRLMGAQYVDGRPTWRLLPDHAGQSHALGVARRLGLPGPVLARAEELLGHREHDLGDLLERAESELSAVRLRAEQVERRASDLDAERAALAEREQRLEERRRKLEREAAGELAARLRRHEGEVRRLIAELQRGPDLSNAGRTLERLRGLRGELEQAAAEPAPTGPAPARLGPGDRVLVPSLRREGRVLEVTADGRVHVEVGNLRSWMRVAELLAGREPAAEAPARRERSKAGDDDATGCVAHPGNTLDLRGKRLEEAIEATEAFCDALLLRGEPAAFVLHGHGTGVLKDGIRGWAKRSPYARRWRPAGEGEGGDAWTVIELG